MRQVQMSVRFRQRQFRDYPSSSITRSHQACKQHSLNPVAIASYEIQIESMAETQRNTTGPDLAPASQTASPASGNSPEAARNLAPGALDVDEAEHVRGPFYFSVCDDGLC